MNDIDNPSQGQEGLLESQEDTTSRSEKVIAQRQTEGLDARVSISLSMQRNIGNYENCHFSIRYEQNCRPEEKESMTAELEALATQWIGKRSAHIDGFIRQRERASQNGQNQSQAPK